MTDLFQDAFLGTAHDKLALMRIVVFLPFFVAGYMIKPESLAAFLSNKWVKVVSIFVAVGFLVLFFINTDIYQYLRPIFTGRNSFEVLGRFSKFGFAVRLLCYAISTLFGLSIMSLVPNINIGIISKTGSKTLQIYFWHQVFLLLLSHFGVYGLISSVTGDTIATGVYILIAVAVTFVCSLSVFSFPTKQLLSFGKDKN